MIYVRYFTVSMFFAYLTSRAKNKDIVYLCSAISILVLCLLGGMRAYGIGSDTATYGRPLALSAMASSSLIDYINYEEGAELGYKILTYAIMKTFGHENWCYFFYQLITVGGAYIGAYKHRKYISFPFTFFLWIITFYNTSYNIIRESIAASIIFMNIDQLESKQYLKFAVTIIVAYTFHKSALIVFSLFFGMHYVATSKFFTNWPFLKNVLVCVAVVAMFFLKSILASFILGNTSDLDRYGTYIYAYAILDDRYAGGRTTLLILGAELFMIFLYEKNGRSVLAGKSCYMGNIDFYKYNVLFCFVYVYAVQLMTGRVLAYSSFINVFLMAAFPRFVKEKHLRFMVFVAVTGYCVLLWYYQMIMLGHSQTYPYRSIMNNILL